ncbi:MAG: exosortase/archaeosortase family protein [Alphaproteobacteria bacterium]|nr:exosortase/archaeosortase family protein [Alphaproteobacteria bacterium]
MRQAALVAAPLGLMIMLQSYLGGSDEEAIALAIVALISAFLVLPRSHPRTRASTLLPVFALASAAAFGIGLSVGPAKLVPLSGMLLFGGATMQLLHLPLRHALPFLTCLLFAVPLPAAFEGQLGLALADVEATAFVGVAQTLGIAVYQFGTQIVLGETAATINSDCSGTLLLWPAILGAMVARSATSASLWRSFTIIVSSVFLALTLNLVRLAILLPLNFYAADSLAGGMHDFLGWIIMPLAWLLPVLIWGASAKLALKVPSITVFEATLAAIILITAGFLSLWLPKDTPSIRPPDLPFYVAGWTGEPGSIPLEEAQILGAHHAERRLYRSPTGRRELVITFMQHESAKKANEHTSKACYEAIGWQVRELQTLASGSGAEIRHLLVRSFDQRQAITEIVLPPLTPDHQGATRLQIVEDPTVPVTERHATAMAFAGAFGLELGGSE